MKLVKKLAYRLNCVMTSTTTLAMVINILACLFSVSATPDSKSTNLTYVTMNGRMCMKCPPGTYWLGDCVEDYHVAKCRMCPDNYYSDTHNRAGTCHPCSTRCSVRKMVTVQPCSSTSDSLCECPSGYYFTRRKDGNFGNCYPLTKCDKGYGVQQLGNKTSNTKCESCRHGCTYSDVSSAVDTCKSCTSCGSYEVLLECGVTHDTVCGVQLASTEHKGNSTVDNVESKLNQNFPLIVVLGLIFSITVFVLVLIVIKLWCRREKYKNMQGINGPMDTSNIFTDHSSMQYALAQDGLSSFYFSDGSSVTPSMRSRTTRSMRSMAPISEVGDKSVNGSLLTFSLPPESHKGQSRSTLNIQFPVSEDNDMWESRYSSVFSFLARKLSPHWKALITRLFIGIGDKQTYSYTRQLEREVRSMREKMYEGLLEWKHRGGDSATPGKLLAALYVLEFHGVISNLREKYPSVFYDDEDDDDRETDV